LSSALCFMSERHKSEPSFEEWAKERLEYVKKSRNRAEAFRDVAEDSILGAKIGFEWIALILSEIESLYSALIVMDGNQEDLNENNVYLKDVVKSSLGLSDSLVTKEQLNERASEFGEFVQGIIDRQNELRRNV